MASVGGPARRLKFGDTIIVSASSVETGEGFLAIDGYAEVKAGIQPLVQGLRSIPSVADAVFTLEPKQSYAAFSRFKEAMQSEGMSFDPETLEVIPNVSKIMRVLKHRTSNIRQSNSTLGRMGSMKNLAAEGPSQARKEENQPEAFDYGPMKHAVQKEREANKRLIERHLGHVITFGEDAQLYHRKSGTYLSVEGDRASEGNAKSLAVSLGHGSAASSWTIEPRFKLHSEGDVIHDHDHACFVSHEYQQTLAVNFNYVVQGDSRYEVHAGKERTGFRIHQYAAYEDPSVTLECLNGGEVVRFYHKEAEGYLNADGYSDAGIDSHDVHCLQTPETADGLSNSLFRIEFSNDTHGGLAKWTDTFTLRHVTSRKYLIPGDRIGREALSARRKQYEEEIDLESEAFRAVLVDEFSEKCIFRFEPIYQVAKTIRLQAPLRIINKSINAYLHVNIVDGDTDPGKLIRFAVELNTVPQESDSLLLRRVPQDELQAVNIVQASLAALARVLNRLKMEEVSTTQEQDTETPANEEEDKVFSRHEQTLIDRVVSKLILFTTTNSNDPNPLTREGTPIPKRQLLLSEQGVLDALVELLQMPFKNSQFEIGTLSESSDAQDAKIYRLVCLMCTLLKHTVRGNIKVADSMMRHLDVIRGLLAEGLDVAAGVIMETYKGNKRLLNDLPPEQMSAFVGLMRKRGRHAQYIEFLHAMVECDGSFIVKNQQRIADLLLKDLTGTLFLMEVRGSKDHIFVLDDGMRPGEVEDASWLEFNQFQDRAENHAKVRFVGLQFHLLAAVCRGRNIYCQRLVELHYPMEMARKLALDEGVSYPVRTGALEYVRAAFLDAHPNEYHPPISLVSQWSKLGAKREVTTDLRFRDLIGFIQSFLKQFKFMVASDLGRNVFGKSVLGLLKDLVHFGYFETKEIKAMIPLLLCVLDGREDIMLEGAAPTDDRFDLNESTRPMFDTKHCVLDIFATMQGYLANDTRVRLLLLFKRLQSKYPMIHGQHANDPKAILRSQSPFDALGPSLSDIVTDVLNYNDVTLTTKAFDLLIRHNSRELEAYDLVQRTLILMTSESVRTYEICKDSVARLRELIDMTNIGDHMEITSIFTNLTDRLSVGEEEEAHEGSRTDFADTQQIMRNVGAHMAACRYLGRLSAGVQREAIVLRKVFDFLSTFVRRNAQNQECLKDHMSDFFVHMKSGVETNTFLHELFLDNRSMCNRFADEIIIATSKGLITEKEDGSTQFQPSLLTLYSALSVPDRRPLRHTQRLLMDLFDDYPDLLRLYNGEEGRQRKREEIARGLHKLPDTELSYHVELMRLLTAMCTGLNAATEAKLQHLMPLDEVLQHLADPDTMSIQGSMIEFAIMAYLEIEREYAVFSSPYIWTAMEQLTKDLYELIPVAVEDDFKMIDAAIRFMHALVEKFPEEFVNGGRDDVMHRFVKNACAYTRVKIIRGSLHEFLHTVSISNLSESITAACEENYAALNRIFHSETERAKARGDMADLVRREHPDLSLEFQVETQKEIFCADLLETMTGGRIRKRGIAAGDVDGGHTNEFRALVDLFIPDQDTLDGATARTHQDSMVRKLIMCVTDDPTIHTGQVKTHIEILTSLALKQDQFGSKSESQNRMHDLGCTNMVLRMIARHVEHDMLKEVLECGIAIFTDGNEYIQKWLNDYFRDDSQAFFNACRYLLMVAEKEVSEASAWWSRFDKMRGTLDMEVHADTIANLLPPLIEESSIQELLRFLQVICENHYSPVQEYLEDQENNIQSFDLVAHTTQYLVLHGQYGIDHHNIAVVIQVLETLIEFCQGPVLNHQKKLASSKVPIILVDILAMSPRAMQKEGAPEEEIKSHIEGLYNMKRSAADCLLAMLEGCQNDHVPSHLADVLKMDTLQLVLQDGYEALLEQELQELKGVWHLFDKFGRDLNIDGCGPCVMAFQVFFVILTMAAFSSTVKMHMTEWEEDPDIGKVLLFYRSHTGELEICSVERKVQIIYFRIPDICMHLSKQTKRDVLWSVDRSSPMRRVDDFQQRFEMMHAEMEQLDKLENSFFHAFFELRAYEQHMYGMILSLAVAINVALMYTELKDKEVSDFVEGQTEIAAMYGDAVPWADLIECWTTVCQGESTIPRPLGLVDEKCVVLLTGQLHCGEWWAGLKFEDASIKFGDDVTLIVLVCGTILTILAGINFIIFCAKNTAVYTKVAIDASQGTWLGTLLQNRKSNDLTGLPRWRLGLGTFLILVQRTEYLVPAFAFAFGILGLFRRPFYFSLHLFVIINIFAELQNVIRAVTKNGLAVLLVACLGLITVYLWGVMGYEFFRDKYANDMGMNCYELIQCTAVTLSGGLRKSDVGEYVRDGEYDGTMDTVPISLFLFGFYFIILTLLLNIIFGIIIDTFGELRTRRANTKADMDQYCFICGIDSNTFERFVDGFQNHTTKRHDMWTYAFFYTYLQQKDPSDYTGPELYVSRTIKQKSIDWFPLNMAAELEMVRAAEEEENAMFKAKAKDVRSNAEALVSEVNGIGKVVEDTKLECEAVLLSSYRRHVLDEQ